MINLSYTFDQNSCSLQLGGMPDVSNGDSEQTIGILSSWTLKIIGSPLLEGKKEHLSCMFHVILKYSRSYISGIRKTFKSPKNIVSLAPFGKYHKLLLNSTQKDVKPLEILLDDAELSDLTRCFDLIRFDPRININWEIELEKPYTRRYINSHLNKSGKNLNFLYALLIFFLTTSLLSLLPINNNYEMFKNNNNIETSNELNNK